MIETLLTALYDERPELRKNKMPLTFLVCFMCFILGIPCVMEGGQYVLNLMDTYGGGISVVFLAVSEVIGVSWVYGMFSKLIQHSFNELPRSSSFSSS